MEIYILFVFPCSLSWCILFFVSTDYSWRKLRHVTWRHKQESAHSKLNKLTVEHNHNVVFYLNIQFKSRIHWALNNDHIIKRRQLIMISAYLFFCIFARPIGAGLLEPLSLTDWVTLTPPQLLQLYYSKKFGGFHPKWEEVNILLLQQLIYCKKFGGFHPKWEEVNISLLQL